jgi:hypothetical protein
MAKLLWHRDRRLYRPRHPPYGRIVQDERRWIAAQRFGAFERAFLVRPHQPRIPRHIRGEDGGETAGLAHFVQLLRAYYSVIPAFRSPSAIQSSVGCE